LRYVFCVTLACFIDFTGITGNAIKCVGFEQFHEGFAEDYCWTQGIYTNKMAYDLRDVRGHSQVPYPGIVPEEVPLCIPGERTVDGGRIVCNDPEFYKKPERYYHQYYQFVQFYFWAASCLFFMPYMMYIVLGIGDIKPILKMLHNPVCDDETFEIILDKAARWLQMRFEVYAKYRNVCSSIFERHNLFFTVIGVKVLYCIFTVGMMYLTHNMFENGSFVSYGFDWVHSRPPNNSVSSLAQDKLFPKMAACEIKRWGLTGIERTRGMCVLTQNVANSYIFIVFWFCLMVCIGGNFIGLFLAILRLTSVHAGYNNLCTLTFNNNKSIRALYGNVGSSGRIIMHQLANNVHPNTFEKVMERTILLMMEARREEKNLKVS